MKKITLFITGSALAIGLIVPQAVLADSEQAQNGFGPGNGQGHFQNQSNQFGPQGKQQPRQGNRPPGQMKKHCPDSMEAFQEFREVRKSYQNGEATEEEVHSAAQNLMTVHMDCKIDRLEILKERVAEHHPEDADTIISIIEGTQAQLESIKARIATTEDKENMQALREEVRTVMEEFRSQMDPYRPADHTKNAMGNGKRMRQNQSS